MSIAYKPRILVFGLLALFVCANALLFGGHLTAWVADHTGHWFAPIVSRLGVVRAVIGIVVSRVNLAEENRALYEQNQQLQSQLAQHDDLLRQIEFYRTAAGIRDRLGTNPIDAGIFSYPQSNGTRQIVVNRGARDSVAVGNIVMTASGVFVGIVEQVYDQHAIVRMVGDSNLQIAVLVSGTNVSGLLRADMSGATFLDLVQKDETVREEQIIVTSGDDQYPAGLVVGTIRSVNNDAATLFKLVRVAPSAGSSIRTGRVIILRQ